MRTPTLTVRRPLRISLLLGLLAAVLLMAASAVLAVTQHQTFQAESVVVVLPDAKLDPASTAAYYETMSRGQIVATFAEVADNLRFEQQAEDTLRLTAEQKASVSTTVSVVPNTSVILVQATAGEPRVAEQVADGTVALASQYLSNLSKPYRTEVVHGAEGSAFATGISPKLLLALGLVVSLIAGLALQQGLYHLLTALNRNEAQKNELRRNQERRAELRRAEARGAESSGAEASRGEGRPVAAGDRAPGAEDLPNERPAVSWW